MGIKKFIYKITDLIHSGMVRRGLNTWKRSEWVQVGAADSLMEDENQEVREGWFDIVEMDVAKR
jgi:hypothetical protein